MTERDETIEPDAALSDAGEFGTDDLDTPDEGLLSQLALIDDQPLADRAAAFAQLHDALRQQLEA
ncbi:hypothetical protein [Microcella sp.]|uniref:hypothetical protein n=1 Tax=Microcella sp. TaxID=1913979 RepID=UPI003918BC09